MLTLNDNWIAAFEAGQRVPIVLVTITTATGTTYRFTSGDRNVLASATMGLIGVEANAASLDPLSRVLTIGSWSLIFADEARQVGRLRALAAATVLKGRKVTIHIGELALVEADYEKAAENMVIDDVRGEGGEIRIELLDSVGFLLEATASPYYHPHHPIRLAKDILGDVISPSIVETAEFDETLDTTTSHFVVSRHPWQRTNVAWGSPSSRNERERAHPYVASLLSLVNGSLRPTEDGGIGLTRYDRTTTSARTFSAYEIADFEGVDGFADIVNDIRILGRRANSEEDGAAWPYYRAQHPDSPADFAWPGETERFYEHTIPSEDRPHPWLNSFGRISKENIGPTQALDSVETSISVYLPQIFGFAGTVVEDGSGNQIEPPSTPTQRTAHTITADRPAYLLITAHGEYNATISGPEYAEIVKATSFAFDTSPYGSLPYFGREWWAWGTYTVTRGQLGTTARDWRVAQEAGVLYVYDITIPVWLAQQRLDRFGYGAPRIAFTVPMRHADVQIGDAVSLTRDSFLAYGMNGITTDHVWEVIEKEPRWFGPNPGWRLTCSLIRKSALQAIVEPVWVADEMPVVLQLSDEVVYDDSGEVYVNDDGEAYYGPPGG